MMSVIHNIISNNTTQVIFFTCIMFGILFRFFIDAISKKLNISKQQKQKIEQEAIIAQNAISMVLNHIAQIDTLPISGIEKKRMVVAYIIQTLGKTFVDYIERHHGSIQAFVEFVFRTMFKK